MTDTSPSSRDYLQPPNIGHLDSDTPSTSRSAAWPVRERPPDPNGTNHPGDERSAAYPIEGAKPFVAPSLWDEESVVAYVVTVGDKELARRADNDYINGTKLLNLTNLTRGKRDTVLKVQPDRHVVKTGAVVLKGVWITLASATALCDRYGLSARVFPLLAPDLESFVYAPNNRDRTRLMVALARDRHKDGMPWRRAGAKEDELRQFVERLEAGLERTKEWDEQPAGAGFRVATPAQSAQPVHDGTAALHAPPRRSSKRRSTEVFPSAAPFGRLLPPFVTPEPRAAAGAADEPEPHSQRLAMPVPPPPALLDHSASRTSLARPILHHLMSHQQLSFTPTLPGAGRPSISPTTQTSHVRTPMERDRFEWGDGSVHAYALSPGSPMESFVELMSMGRRGSGAWPVRLAASPPVLLQLAPISSPPEGPRTLPPMALHPRRYSDPPSVGLPSASQAGGSGLGIDQPSATFARAHDSSAALASATHRRPSRGLGLWLDTRDLPAGRHSPPLGSEGESSTSVGGSEDYSRGSSLGKRSADSGGSRVDREVGRARTAGENVAGREEGTLREEMAEMVEAANGLKRFRIVSASAEAEPRLSRQRREPPAGGPR